MVGLKPAKRRFLPVMAVWLLVVACIVGAAQAEESGKTAATCGRYSDAAARALCEQLLAKTSQDIGAPRGTATQQLHAKAQYHGDDEQQEPWYYQGPDRRPSDHQYERDNAYGRDEPVQRSRHHSPGTRYPQPAPSVPMDSYAYPTISLDIAATTDGLTTSGELTPGADYNEAGTVVKVSRDTRLTTIGTTPPRTLYVSQYFKSQAPLKLVVGGTLEAPTELTVSGKLVSTDATILISKEYPWAQATIQELQVPYPTFGVLISMDAPELMCIYGADIANGTKVAPFTTRTMMQFTEDALLGEPAQSEFKLSLDVFFSVCFRQQSGANNVTSDGQLVNARKACDDAVDSVKRQKCQQMFEMLNGRDGAAAGPGGRAPPPRLSAPGGQAKAASSDSPGGYFPVPGGRTGGDDDDDGDRFYGRQREDYSEGQEDAWGSRERYQASRWQPFRVEHSPSDYSRDPVAPLLSKSTTTVAITLTTSAPNATGHLTQANFDSYGIALKRTVQQQDVAVTPEVEGKLYVEQGFSCASPTHADFSFVGPVVQPTTLSAQCLLEPDEYAFIAVGARYPWREALKTKLEVTCPAQLSYSATVPEVNTYNANITRITSPVEFEGCSLDLVMDALLGRPPQFPLEVTADSFVQT